MRFLIIGDIHGDIESLIKIISLDFNKKFDAIILVGDIGLPILTLENYSISRYKKQYELSCNVIFQSLKKMRAPVFFIPGNWDAKNIKVKSNNIFNVDIIGTGKLCLLDQFVFAGIGGCSYINGLFQYEWSEEETLFKASEILSNISNNNLILVSHDPPSNSNLDLNSNNIHCGSESVRKIINKFSPIICICGHIHESVGLDVIGNTLCLNAGKIKDEKNEELFFVLDFTLQSITIEHYCIGQHEIIINKAVVPR